MHSAMKGYLTLASSRTNNVHIDLAIVAMLLLRHCSVAAGTVFAAVVMLLLREGSETGESVLLREQREK